jgi:hypothetical protein
VANENKVVISVPPSVVDAGTKVGGLNRPAPLVMTCVEVPEMIVVVAPLMIVVTRNSVVIIGCCTMVRIRVVVHDHDVEYTPNQ